MPPDGPAADASLLDEVIATLRQHGNRSTTARRILLAVLMADRSHRGAEEIAADVQARAPDIHLTTIYRNLDELERLSVIDRTRLRHGPATYHLAQTAHGHLVCENCGSLTEVPDNLFTELAQAAAENYGFKIQPQRFAATGLCSDCQLPGHHRQARGTHGPGAPRAGKRP